MAESSPRTKRLKPPEQPGLTGVITVERTGDQLVVVQRTDLNLDDVEGA
jgi:hypothetical protein